MLSSFKNFILLEGKSKLQKFRHFKKAEVTIVDIRKSFNSYSSRDKHAFKYGDHVKQLQKIPWNYSMSKSRDENLEVDGQMILIHHVTIAGASVRRTDELSEYHMEEFFNKIMKKLGFSEGYPDFYVDKTNQENFNRDIIREKDREQKDYVLTKSYPKKHDVKDCVGGFDLDIFFREHLISYVEKGFVNGYIGHSCRKKWVDRLLSEICLKAIKPDDFACWLTSTAGRHFGDEIEYAVEHDDHDYVKRFIQYNLSNIHDQAVIFNSPNHGGTLKSSNELFDKYKDMGMMMGDEYVYGFRKLPETKPTETQEKDEN